MYVLDSLFMVIIVIICIDFEPNVIYYCQAIKYNIGINENLTVFMPNTTEKNITLLLHNITFGKDQKLDDVVSEIQKINNTRLDYIIYEYHTTPLIISEYFKIPYLITTPLQITDRKSSTSFYTLSFSSVIHEVIKKYFLKKQIRSYVLIEDDKKSSHSFIVKYYPQTLNIIKENGTFKELFESVFVPNNENCYIINTTNTEIINEFLEQAIIFGQLVPGKTIIFSNRINETTAQSISSTYQCVGGDLLTFSLNVDDNYQTDLASYTNVLAQDYINIIGKSVESFKLKMNNTVELLLKEKLNSSLVNGKFGFDNTDKSYSGFIVSIRKLNTPKGIIDVMRYDMKNLVDVGNTPLLKNTLVRIGVILSTGYLMKSKQGKYYGYSVGLLEELRKLSNFQYEFKYPDKQVTGENVVNGTVEGIIELLMNDKADMSIIPMVADKINLSIFYSDLISTMRLNMLTRPPDVAYNFVFPLTPFTYNVWVGILLLFIISSFAFWSITALSFVPKQEKSSTSSKGLGEQSFLVLFASFVMAKLKVTVTLPSQQLFVFLLWFCSLMFVIMYASNMLPFLMQPTAPYSFSRMTELSTSKTDYRWAFVKENFDVELIQKDKSVANLYEHALKEWPNETFVSDLDSLSVVRKNKFVLIQNSQKNSYYYQTNCFTDMLLGTEQIYLLRIVMRNDWPQRFEMRSLISQLFIKGKMTELDEIYFRSGTCARSGESITPSPEQLGLSRLISLFLIPGVGVVFCLLYLFLAFCIQKIRRMRELKTQTKFSYGDSYSSTIHSVEKNGVWAFIANRSRPYFIHNSSLNPDMRKVLTATELGLKSGSQLNLKYFGKDPINKEKRFCVDFEAETDV